MKRVLTAALAALIMITLSGCQPATGDISDMMTPPKLTAEQQAIENALTDYEGAGKFTLKYPREGDYRSAFILHNLDNDQEQEAIAFYCPNADNAGTHMMILKKIKNKWKKVNDYSSPGNDVDRIDFGDYYGTGHDDIAIAWTQLTDTNLGLVVYSINGDKHTFSGTFSAMKTVDLTGDGKQDILLLTLDQTAKKASASLISYRDGKLQEIAKTPLDPTMSSFAGVYTTKVDNKNAVLVDCYRGQHGMLTELLTWDNGVMSSPSLDKSSKTVSVLSQFTRTVSIDCADIDNNGSYEIPSAVELPGYADKADYSQKLWRVSWSVFAGGVLSAPSVSCMSNSAQGYYFTCPQKWAKNDVTVDNSAGDNEWIFKVWNGTKMTDTLFTLSVYTESEWQNAKEIGNMNNIYEVIDNNGIVYVATLNTRAAADPRYLDINEIKQNFRLMS